MFTEYALFGAEPYLKRFMAELPLVSIVTPTYNQRRYIVESLRSSLAQTYSNIEVVLVDDASTDDTLELVSSMPEFESVRVVHHERNQGGAEARNNGCRVARGRYIVYQDSDDVLEPNHVQKMVDILNAHPDVGFASCDAITIGPSGELLRPITFNHLLSQIKNYPLKEGIRSLDEIFMYSVSSPGLTIRREVFDEVGYLEQELFPLEDYDFHLRVAGSRFKVYYCDQPLVRYRHHGNNGSGTTVRVNERKLKCLRLALERNPELKSLGKLVPARLAEVYMELAITHFYGRQWGAGLKAFTKASALDSSQLLHVTRLGLRRVRRQARLQRRKPISH